MPNKKKNSVSSRVVCGAVSIILLGWAGYAALQGHIVLAGKNGHGHGLRFEGWPAYLFCGLFALVGLLLAAYAIGIFADQNADEATIPNPFMRESAVTDNLNMLLRLVAMLGPVLFIVWVIWRHGVPV